MASRKKTTKHSKPHYVKSRKRKGAGSGVLAQRSVVIIVVLLVVASVITGIALGFRWIGSKLFSANPRFEIQYLEIASDGKLREEQIREYTGLREGMNLFEFTFKDIQKSLAKVPIVESVELERKLPNTLYVSVKERVPVARILIPGSKIPRFLDRYGYVLPPNRNPALAQLPMIKGLDEEVRLGERVEHRDIETLLTIVALCQSNSKLSRFVKIVSMDIGDLDYIDMRLEGGIQVKMPRYRLQKKLQELATIIQMAQEQGRRVKQVDLILESSKVPVTYY